MVICKSLYTYGTEWGSQRCATVVVKIYTGMEGKELGS